MLLSASECALPLLLFYLPLLEIHEPRFIRRKLTGGSGNKSVFMTDLKAGVEKENENCF